MHEHALALRPHIVIETQGFTNMELLFYQCVFLFLMIVFLYVWSIEPFHIQRHHDDIKSQLHELKS